MATSAEVAFLRDAIDEHSDDIWTDAELEALIDAHGTEEAAARAWDIKAARFSALVDVQEAGASRKMSQMFEHAQKMATYWSRRTLQASDGGRTRVHKIVRE